MNGSLKSVKLAVLVFQGHDQGLVIGFGSCSALDQGYGPVVLTVTVNFVP